MPTLPAAISTSDYATEPPSDGPTVPHTTETQEVPEQKKGTRWKRTRNVHQNMHVESQGLEGLQTAEGRLPRNNTRRQNTNQRKVGGQTEVPTGGQALGPSNFPSHSDATGSARRGRGSDGRGRGRGQNASAVPARGGGRRKQINAKLTGSESKGPSEATMRPTPRREQRADNLTNRLIDSLRTPPYADCPICFNAIRPAQPIWSCSPSGSHESTSKNTPGDTQCCYTPFHLKCIKSWASKSVKDMREAYLARGELENEGEWRCPGCQRKRLHVPMSYVCFCGSTPDPQPPRLATPHSCGNPCSRPRACNHACSLSCHPGPCPPCQITMQFPCHCNRQLKSFRCADYTSLSASGKTGSSSAGLSCGNVCDSVLSCGKHRCPKPCHPGRCEECPIVETGRCYCGKTSNSLKCGEGEEEHCSAKNEGGVLEDWDGRFACEYACGRAFACGVHKCEKSCHLPSASPPQCPRSPSRIERCPCGKRLLEELEGGVRQICTDPIATCGNMCMKKLEGCQHVCSVPCHIGPCPPCALPLIVPCRCGSTTRAVKCHESTSTNCLEILCDRSCTALRACGRHRCNRLCCPLAALDSGSKGKGKKRQTQVQPSQSLEYGLGDEARWHECDLICGKTLGCGNHQCEERDHRGMCPPCLGSSFEEIICYCGRTIIEPPIPCGTRMSCSYPCSRPPLSCGHPKSPHTCHEDPSPCPPCPFLTSKACACGKNTVNNVRCSQEKVSCGTSCGKLLDCGFHHCERLCHGEDCGTCTSICGKSRKLCLPARHGCTAPCHAPAACSEDEPCQAAITLRCPCGRQQQPSQCRRSTSNPAGREVTQPLKCTNECAVAKRNARLAEALGISKEVQDRDSQRPVTYSNELVAFAHANTKFCAVVEKLFAGFVNSERKSQILPHMHEGRRKFVHGLAGAYRMDTQMIDQEPQRSVQLIRRVDTRIPKPLLSSVASPPNNLGKLTDLRASPHTSAPVSRPNSAASNPLPHTASVGGGWTAVVANPASQAQVSASAWNLPGRPADGRTLAGGEVRTNNVEQPAPRLVPLGRSNASLVVPRTDQSTVPDSWENDEA